MLKKAYILVNHLNLELILNNLLEIIGYLPIVINDSVLNKKKILKIPNKDIIFTNYYNIQNNIEVLNYFKNIIVFIPYGESFVDINVNTNSRVIFFSKILTVNNIKEILEKLNPN